MNERYETYDDEMEIDLIDFLFYLLRRWKSLVAMILLGAVLGSAFYVVKTTKSANVVVEDYQPGCRHRSKYEAGCPVSSSL